MSVFVRPPVHARGAASFSDSQGSGAIRLHRT